MKDEGRYTSEEFSHKYDLYSPIIYRLCAIRLGNKSDAEDAMQNTFIKMFYKAPDFGGNLEKEKAWLIRVAINCCKDFQKAFWTKNVIKLEDTSDLSCGTIEEAVKLIDLFELSPKNRTVLQLFYYEGYSINEISQILKISVNSVTSRLTRARKKLKMEMEACNDEETGVVSEH